MTREEAKEFFALIEKKAIEAGHKVEFAESISVDEESESFVSKCFENL